MLIVEGSFSQSVDCDPLVGHNSMQALQVGCRLALLTIIAPKWLQTSRVGSIEWPQRLLPGGARPGLCCPPWTSERPTGTFESHFWFSETTETTLPLKTRSGFWRILRAIMRPVETSRVSCQLGMTQKRLPRHH